VRLGVEVDQADALARLGQGRAEVDGRRRLADAALLVHQGDDPLPVLVHPRPPCQWVREAQVSRDS
jgi:hypothetical protein